MPVTDWESLRLGWKVHKLRDDLIPFLYRLEAGRRLCLCRLDSDNVDELGASTAHA